MKTVSKLLVFALVLFGVNAARAQQSLQDDHAIKMAEVKQFVNSQNFSFEATSESSKKGTRQLGTGYYLNISKSLITAAIPGYTSSMSSMNAGFGNMNKYSSANFDYQTTNGPNNGWVITIKPTSENVDNMGNITELKLTIAPLGHTSLLVTRSKQAPVSFEGYIKANNADMLPVSAQLSLVKK